MIADIFCCGLGFVIAYKVRFLWQLAIFVATEAMLLIFIRDSLVINVILLIYPMESIRQRQTAGL